MKLNLDFVRKQFPSLNDDFVLFDNAGGSQILKSVVDHITDYYFQSNVQHGASYEISQIATDRVLEATRAVATLVNAKDASEIVMGPSTTMLLQLLASSLSNQLKEGDEIIVSNSDHEANIGPWMNLEKQGIVIKEWKVDPNTFDLNLDDLQALMTDRTKLVAVTHASNVLGTINPIKEIAKLVHQNDALLCVDAVAYAPHRMVDVEDLDVDFYVFSFYKVYGPHHAVLYGKREHLLQLPGLNHFFIGENEIPYKLQPGNVNFELSYGILGICDYLSALAEEHNPNFKEKSLREKILESYSLIENYEEKLSTKLLDYLNGKLHVHIIGHPEPDSKLRVPTISFVVDDMKSSQLILAADEAKIGIRYGDFYARRLIDALNLSDREGVVRVSMVHYNTLDEIDRLIEVFERVIPH